MLASSHFRYLTSSSLCRLLKDCTWGVAYKVLPQDVPDVMMYLDRREVGGYCTERIKFYPHADTAQPFDVLAYIANGHNPNYLGPAPLDHIAEQIVRSRGPSGENTEYVLELAQAMRTLAPHVVDEHLFALERKVLELLAVPHPAPSPVDPCKGSDDGVCGQTFPCTKPLGNVPVNQGNGTLPDNQGNGLLPDNGPYQITKEREATLTEKFK